MMLHTAYQGSRPYGFRQEDFSRFPYISLCNTCDPRGGPFWPQGYNLNKLDRGLLGDATYQGLMVSEKKIFSMCIPIYANVNNMTQMSMKQVL